MPVNCKDHPLRSETAVEAHISDEADGRGAAGCEAPARRNRAEL